MANDVYNYVKKCVECRVHQRHVTHLRLLQLVPLERALGLVAMAILGLVPKTKIGNIFIVLVTDGCLKLTRSIPTKKRTAFHFSSILLKIRIMMYGIPECMLTHNGPQFVETFFNAVCIALGRQPVTKATYRPRTNDHTERYN